jgi:integrase
MAGSISTVTAPDGSKRYRARYREAGGRQHEKRCRRKVDAQQWLDEQTSALVTQTWTASERGRVTVEVWVEQWVAAQTGLKPSTLYRYRSLLRTQILPRWGRYRLADVSHADVATWVAQMSTGGLAPANVRQAHRVFSLLLTLAVRDGRIPRNPAVGGPLPRVRRADPRFLNRDEVERLAEAAGECGDVVHLLAYTGLRFGEMAGLRVRRVDFLRKRLTVAESATEVGGTVKYGAPKTHQQRTVPIPGVLLAPLSRRC